jgi:hypothetical protein
VAPEPFVLDGDDSVPDGRRHLVELEDVPVDLAVEVRDDLAGAVVDLRRGDRQPLERFGGRDRFQASTAR